MKSKALEDTTSHELRQILRSLNHAKRE